LLENNQLRVELNPAGDIIRIYDKANQREVLPQIVGSPTIEDVPHHTIAVRRDSTF